MDEPTLEGVDTLAVNMRRLIEPPKDLTGGDIRLDFTVEVATQDVDRQVFGFIALISVVSVEATVDVRLGLRYSGLPKVWNEVSDEGRVEFVADILTPDAYPYVRSLVQISSGVLGIAPVVLPSFDPGVMKAGLHTKDQ